MQLDLSDTDSIHAFVDEFDKKNFAGLHMLINNAGIMNTASGKTKQGHELQFGTNHLGHYLLTELLLPKLKASGPARVVNVSSEAHRMMPESIDTIYDDVGMDKSYSGWASYSRSKLSNVLHAFALNRRLKDTSVTAVALHPGVIYTNLWDHTTGGSVFGFLGRPFMKTVQQGAATTIFCATYPGLEGGKFYQDCHVATPLAKANNEKLQDDLWDISRKLLNLK